MDPDSDARLPSSGPQRRTRAARVSLNVTPSASSSSLAASPSTPGGKSSGANVRGSPYARPTPSPRAPTEGDDGAASTGTPGLFASLFRGALGSIGWGGASTTPSKKPQTPKDGKTAAAAAVEQGDAFASIGRSPAPNLATPSTRASSRLTTSRSLSHLAPGPRTSTSYAPSPLRGSTTASINNIHNASGSGSGSGTGGAYPPSAWPGASNPVGTSRRSRSRGPSRDASPALTNVSAHVAIRRQPSVGMSSRTSGLYQASTGGYGQGRPVSMVAMPTGHSMSEFGAAGASSGGAGAGAASFHVPNFSPFAAPAYYRAGSVSASSRGGTPVRRAGSLVPGYAPGTGTGAGAPSPLGPGSRAGSVGGESVGTVFTSGGTPLRRADRRSLNLSSTVVRRTPSMFSISGSGSGSGSGGGANHLGLPVGGRGSGRGTTPRRSEGEAMLEQYMKSAEGEEDLERMSVQPGSRMDTPLAQNAYGGRQGSLRAASLLPGTGGARNRSVAPSPSPGPVRGAAGAFRSAGFGRLYSVTPSRGGSPAVGQKRGVESVQGEEWERLDSLSIEPSRKKQVIFNEQEGRYMTVEQMRALQPRRAGPWNTADRILNELEGVRTPLGDSQTLARRALLTGMPLPAHVAVPEPRANISSAKAAANRMLPPSLPLSSSSRAAGSSQSLKPIGPYARRQALHLRMAKRLADQAEGGKKGLSLREQVEAIRARDGDIGAGRTAQVKKKAGGDEDMDEDATATAAAEEEEPEPEPEVQQKKTRKGKGKAADVSADAEMAGVTPEAESLGSKRTLRPRKAKTPTAEPAPTEKKGGASKMAKVAAAPPAAEKSEVTPEPAKASASSSIPPSAPAPVLDSAAKETAASTLKPKPAKSDAFQVLSDSAARPGSSTSSLRQRTEKKFRQHEKSSTGRFGIDDDDEEGEDGVGNGEDEVTAEELEKISVPKILFPAGFKFGGAGASAGASGSGATSAAPAKSASLFGTPSTVSSSTTSALKAPAVNLPALPPPTDLQPATSLFDRMGDKASSSSADASASPKKVVTFATPISSVTTFQTGSSAGGSSGDTSSAPPASASGFQFKAPTSGAPMFPPAPKAAASTPSDFFSKPAGITAPASSDAGSTPAAAGVPNFFSTSLKKLDTDKPSAPAPAPAPAAQPSSSGTAVPNFFASSLGKPAGSESQAGSSAAATTTTTAPSVPNFFASSSKKSDDASGAAAPASGFSSSAGALKAFTGFGAPAASTSTPAASASAPAAAPAKPMFGSFGGAAAAAPASGAPKASAPPTFSFGAPAATSTATTSTIAAPAPTPSASSIFGSMSAAPSSSSVAATSLFGSSPASKKRSADEDASGSGEHGSSSTGESSAKKPYGGFSFGASTPATPPASSTASSLFGQQASKPAPPGFQFGKSTPTPAPASTASTFGGGFGSAAATNGDSGENSMDTGSPPKAGGFGVSFGGGASAGAGGTSSMFGSSNNNGNSGSAPTSATPTSMGFGQSQPAPASGGFAFGGSKPATPTSNNVFGSGMNGGGSMTNSTSAAPSFGFGQANAQSSAPAQNGFGSNAGSGMTLNTKPNFNFGGGSSTPSAGPGGVFTFGSNTPTQSTTPTLTPASAPFQFGGNSAANAAPSASNGPFAFGAGQQQNNTASQGGMGGFAFGASSGPTGGAGLGPGPGSSGSGSAGPASPFLFGASAPQPSAGLPAPAPGAPVFSLGAAPTGGAGGMGGGARPMRALPKRRK